MRLAILSDIHANLEALTAVMEDIDKQGVEEIVCLGDIVGYGPNPIECLDIVQERIKELDVIVREQKGSAVRSYDARIKPIVKGNHERAMTHGGLSKTGKAIWEWTVRKLSEAQISWMNQLPYAITIPPQDNERYILLAHAEWTRPEEFHYLYPTFVSNPLANENKKSMRKNDILFVGHTHKQAISMGKYWQMPKVNEGKYKFHIPLRGPVLVNVGSVGQPRLWGDDLTTYVVYDADERTVTYHRLRYDYNTTARKIRSLPISAENKRSLCVRLGPFKTP